MGYWERPLVLVLGLPLVVLGFVLLRSQESRWLRPAALSPPGGVGLKTPPSVNLGRYLVYITELITGLSLVAALAGPALLVSQTVWLQQGADILFILDCSPSMSAKDVLFRSSALQSTSGMTETISRFEAARRLISFHIEGRGADAVGLIGVGTEAALLVPPTIDHRAFLDRLDSLMIAELGDGTALGSALAVAAYHLRTSQAERKIVILISDGENNAGSLHPLTAIHYLTAQGAELHIIAVGSVGEVAIDYIDPETGQRRSGIMLSRFDEDGLKAMALAGGGSYYAIGSQEAATAASLAEVFSQLEQVNPVTAHYRLDKRTLPQHQALVIIALISLLASQLIRRLWLEDFL